MLSRCSARRGAVSLLAVALATSAPPLQAQEDDGLTDEQREEAIIYARDNTTYTLYHEIGHLFVDQFQLPVLAKEEDSADNLATLMILDDYDASEDGAVLYNATWYWSLNGEQEIADWSLFDSHSLDKQRAFAMVCVIVGKDKDEFAEIAAEWELAEDKQEECAWTYQQVKDSWDKVLEPHRVPNEGEPKITVIYEDPSADSEWAAEILKSGEVLERAAQTVEESYTLPDDVTFKAEDCGQENAFYSPSERTVTMCYEFVSLYYNQYVTALADETEEGGGEEEASEETASSEEGEESAEE